MLQTPHAEYSGPRGAGMRMVEPLLPGLGGPYAAAEAPALETYHAFDKAHLVMLAEEDLIARDHAAAMLRTLREMETRGVAAVRNETGGGMHSGEQYLIRRLGYNVGGRIHLGRSTGDLGAVSRRLRQRDRLAELMQALNALRAVVLTVAEQHLETVMPGHTGSQHAQPMTLGHQLLAWGSVLERHFERARQAYQRANQSPAGAAILTGSSFAINRHRTAELLGFDAVIGNTFDAIQSHDDEVDALAVAAAVNLSLARWANDITFWYTAEAGYVRIPDRFCGTSSIMAQKRNPAILPVMRTAAAESLGGMVTTFGALNTTSGEFGGDGGTSLHRAFDAAVRGLGWLAELLPLLEIRSERMAQMAGAHWAQATDVAAALVTECDLPWRVAHQIVAVLVRLAEERGVAPQDVTTDLLDEAAVQYMDEPVGLSAAALQAALDPARFVAARTLYGGPAPEECRRRLPEYHERLSRDVADLAEQHARVERAAQALERAVDALIA